MTEGFINSCFIIPPCSQLWQTPRHCAPTRCNGHQEPSGPLRNKPELSSCLWSGRDLYHKRLLCVRCSLPRCHIFVHRCHLSSVLLEFPVSVVKGANLSGLQPAGDAMEVEGMLDHHQQSCLTQLANELTLQIPHATVHSSFVAAP